MYCFLLRLLPAAAAVVLGSSIRQPPASLDSALAVVVHHVRALGASVPGEYDTPSVCSRTIQPVGCISGLVLIVDAPVA